MEVMPFLIFSLFEKYVYRYIRIYNYNNNYYGNIAPTLNVKLEFFRGRERTRPFQTVCKEIEVGWWHKW
jgi:hypothetical protein